MSTTTGLQSNTRRGFPLHDAESAPAESREMLSQVQGKTGFVPNLLAMLAHSPLLLKAYVSLNQLVDASAFTRTEKQLMMLTASYVNGCAYCMAAHSASARQQRIDAGIISALREGQPLADGRLEALRRFTAAVTAQRGQVSEADLARFHAAGYSQEQALEVVLVVALKTITNYANKLTGLPLDEQFKHEAWEGPAAQATTAAQT